jgi:excisionase family DNA binding protein
MEKKLAFSISQTAALTTVGRTSIYAAIRRGELVVHKIGRRTLISAADLAAWLELHRGTVANISAKPAPDSSNGEAQS